MYLSRILYYEILDLNSFVSTDIFISVWQRKAGFHHGNARGGVEVQVLYSASIDTLGQKRELLITSGWT